MPLDSTHPRRCSVVMSMYCTKCSSLHSSSWNRKRVQQPLHHTVKRGAHTHVARSHQQNAFVTEHKACIEHGGDGGGTGAGRGDGFRRWWNSDGTRLITLHTQQQCTLVSLLQATFCMSSGGASPKVQLLCLLMSCQSWEAQAAGRRRPRHDERHSPWDRNSEADQYATHLTQLAWPVLQNLGFSGAVGLVCAVAFKVCNVQFFALNRYKCMSVLCNLTEHESTKYELSHYWSAYLCWGTTCFIAVHTKTALHSCT